MGFPPVTTVVFNNFGYSVILVKRVRLKEKPERPLLLSQVSMSGMYVCVNFSNLVIISLNSTTKVNCLCPQLLHIKSDSIIADQ
jgi:hypothetical protein